MVQFGYIRMMNITLFLLANLFPIVCVIAGSFLAYHKREGWGWLFFFAILTAVSGAYLLKAPGMG